MYHRFHDRFGTAGVIIAVIALIAALGGTALAKGLFTKAQEKKIVAIAKKYAGKTGPAGPQGPKGDAGAAGAAGAAGKDGTGATTAPFVGAKGGCENGGVEVKSASATTFVCNGQTGFTETLPSEATETGVWSVALIGETNGFAVLPFSFNIPLAAGIADADSEFRTKGATPNANCPGTAGEPEAAPGKFCIYAKEENGGAIHAILDPTKSFEGGAGPTGAVLEVEREGGEEFATGYGTWAVTAP